MADLDLPPEAEVWKVNPSFPDYEISSLGRVRRLTTRTSAKAGTILRAAMHYSGYPQHGLSSEGRTVTIRLSRLVCETFHGPSPTSDHHCAHGDDNPSNNRASNLRWATRLENEADKTDRDRRPIGSRHVGAKLTEEDVREIKKRRAAGALYRVLAEDYGVTTGLIGTVLMGRRWKHVR